MRTLGPRRSWVLPDEHIDEQRVSLGLPRDCLGVGAGRRIVRLILFDRKRHPFSSIGTIPPTPTEARRPLLPEEWPHDPHFPEFPENRESFG